MRTGAATSASRRPNALNGDAMAVQAERLCLDMADKRIQIDPYSHAYNGLVDRSDVLAHNRWLARILVTSKGA